MIIVTGAAGFIGSSLLGALQAHGYGPLVAVDDFGVDGKQANTENKKVEKVERSAFFAWIKEKVDEVQFIFHIGARTDTTEKNLAVLDELNVQYSKDMWRLCSAHNIPLIYASSAATYGNGNEGFDDEMPINRLKPMNLYGTSKQIFDLWVEEQFEQPPFWAGFKFFNVFGPNEYHKGRMASVVFHAYNQIQAKGEVNLFESHRPDYEHGQQQRDFIYVKDLIAVLLYFMETRKNSGLYNLGTGKARSFKDLATAVFLALELPIQINYIPMPEDIRNTYQYYTEASMQKLRKAGYTQPFYNLEDSVKDYVLNYLVPQTYM